MGILDVPKGLISRLPIIGGSDQSKDDNDEPEEPMAETPEPDEPDEVDDEPTTADEPDEPEPDEPDEPDSQQDHPASDPDGSGREAEQPSGSNSEAEQPSGSDSSSGGDSTEDVSDITAPSIGPNTKIEKEDPEERLARHEQSDKDAMGLDKRREVIGGNYSASFGKQVFRWALVVVVIGGAAFGAKILVDDLDKPPAKVADEAPWTGNEQKPADLE